MKRIILIGFIVFVVVACNKDKFETKPHIEINSYNTKEVFPSQDLVIDLEYTDKEGDLGGGTLWANLQRLNQRPLPPNTNKADTLVIPITSFPTHDKGSLSFTLNYGFLKEHPSENDTIQIHFAVTDIAGNASDTITSDNIVIIQQ